MSIVSVIKGQGASETLDGIAKSGVFSFYRPKCGAQAQKYCILATTSRQWYPTSSYN